MLKKLPVIVPGSARLVFDFIRMNEASQGYGAIYGNKQGTLKTSLVSMKSAT